MAAEESTRHQPLTLDESKIRHELNCRAFHCILVYMEEVYGSRALFDFVAKTGLTLDYLRDQNNWVSWSYYGDLLEALVEWTGDHRSPHKAGAYSGHKRSWGTLYYIFLAFGNVGKILKKGVEILPRFNTVAEWTMLSLQNNKAAIRVRMKEGYPARRICCESRMGQAAGISKAFGMPQGSAREIQCQALGADSCIMEVSWLNRPQRVFAPLGLVLGLLLIMILNRVVPVGSIGFWQSFSILLIGYLSGTLVDHGLTQRGNARINQEQTAELEDSVRVIEDKYRELKRAHDGLFAVHEISRTVTSTLRVEEILKTLLRMVVERLGFDRSLVLLSDEERGVLDRGRIYGDDRLTEFVENLKVPLNLESPMAEEVLRRRRGQIVTQEFISGNQAAELERMIFEMTRTREYLIAPLVSQDRLLGVVAADNFRSGKRITEQEKEVMVSLTNQVAMAIENARAFETIEDLNVNLERKVEDRTRALEKSISELKEAQAQLIHSEKMSSLGLLFSGLAHEINNPINFAYNGISALEKSIQQILDLSQECRDASQQGPGAAAQDARQKLMSTIEEANRLMRIIGKGLNRTRNLVADLKLFSRKDREDAEFFVLGSPIQSALTILAHEFSGRIAVHMDLGFTDRIQGYPDQLNQVFLNLVHNAIQAIPEQGNVWIESELEAPGFVRIRIRDDGAGIHPEDLPRVFEPFFTTKKSGEGTGLGMSVCQRIIENHRGKIEVSSELGKGTEVTVTLPLRLDQEVSRGTPPGGKRVGRD